MSKETQKLSERLRAMSPEQIVDAMAFLRREKVSPSAEMRAWASAALREINRAVRQACSMPLIQGFREKRTPYRLKGMVRGAGKVKVGSTEGVTPSRRWTPAAAVRDEDRYDLMSEADAAACGDPPSVTGRQMYELRMRHGKFEEAELARLEKLKKRASA